MNWKPIRVREHYRVRAGEGVKALTQYLYRKQMSEKKYGKEFLEFEDKFNSLKRKLQQAEEEECKSCKQWKEEAKLWKSRALAAKDTYQSVITTLKDEFETNHEWTVSIVETLNKDKNFDLEETWIGTSRFRRFENGNSDESVAEGSKLSKYFNSKERTVGETVSSVSGSKAAVGSTALQSKS